MYTLLYFFFCTFFLLFGIVCCAKLFQTISVLPWSTWWGKLLNCSGNKTEFFCHIRMLILASLNLYRIHIRDLGIFYTFFVCIFTYQLSLHEIILMPSLVLLALSMNIWKKCDFSQTLVVIHKSKFGSSQSREKELPIHNHVNNYGYYYKLHFQNKKMKIQACLSPKRQLCPWW